MDSEDLWVQITTGVEAQDQRENEQDIGHS